MNIYNFLSALKRKHFLLFILLSPIFGYGQIYPAAIKEQASEYAGNPLVLQVDFESGGMLPNNEEVRQNFDPNQFNGINFRLGWQTRRGFYNKLYNYPIYGIGFYSSKFKYKEFGNPYAIYGFVAIPLRERSLNRWNFSYRIGFGVASNFKHFDEESNPLNILIGSRRNCYIDFGAQAHYTLNDHLTLNAGLSFHHFSNGATQLPNKGLNLAPASLSLTYIPGARKLHFENATPHAPIEYIPAEWHIVFAAGARQMNMDDPTRYFKAGLGLYRTKTLGYKWKLGAGVDVFYSSTGTFPEYAGSRKNQFSQMFSLAPAFYVDHVLTEKLYINGGIGVYLHRNESNGEKTNYYERLGLRYKLTEKLFGGVAIKAHGGSADFIEFTTGLSLGRRK